MQIIRLKPVECKISFQRVNYYSRIQNAFQILKIHLQTFIIVFSYKYPPTYISTCRYINRNVSLHSTIQLMIHTYLHISVINAVNMFFKCWLVKISSNVGVVSSMQTTLLGTPEYQVRIPGATQRWNISLLFTSQRKVLRINIEYLRSSVRSRMLSTSFYIILSHMG